MKSKLKPAKLGRPKKKSVWTPVGTPPQRYVSVILWGANLVSVGHYGEKGRWYDADGEPLTGDARPSYWMPLEAPG